MALYVSDDLNKVLSEEELKKVSGGKLHCESMPAELLQGYILYSDQSELAGARFRVVCSDDKSAMTAMMKKMLKAEADGLADVYLVRELMAEGYIVRIND